MSKRGKSYQERMLKMKKEILENTGISDGISRNVSTNDISDVSINSTNDSSDVSINSTNDSSDVSGNDTNTTKKSTDVYLYGLGGFSNNRLFWYTTNLDNNKNLLW